MNTYRAIDIPEHLKGYFEDCELGSEPTIGEFIATMTGVFDLAREVLADDGTLWLNMGDSYASDAGKRPKPTTTRNQEGHNLNAPRVPAGLKPKDLIGQPWRLAFALQDAGWWLRSDIIWDKSNPMPGSAKDRPTTSHEYMFLLAKSERYYFDFDAFQEPVSGGANARRRKVDIAGWATGPGSHSTIAHNTPKARGVGFGHGTDAAERGRGRVTRAPADDAAPIEQKDTRNRRTVWTIPTQGFKGAHFATFPEKLVEPCVLAGSKPGGVVMDIFFGTGTVGQVAQRLGRNYIGIDLNTENLELQSPRLCQRPLELEPAA